MKALITGLLAVSATYAGLLMRANESFERFETAASLHAETMLEKACANYAYEPGLLVENDVLYASDLTRALDEGFAERYAIVLAQQRYGQTAWRRYGLDPIWRARTLDEQTNEFLLETVRNTPSLEDALAARTRLRNAPALIQRACDVDDWVDA